jgi:hypothetical protein
VQVRLELELETQQLTPHLVVVDEEDQDLLDSGMPHIAGA